MSVKTINIALQGGGSHGAYTWGILDALNDDERIDIEGISATSAGSMNACAYASGKLKNGRQGAKDNLEKLWGAISDYGQVFNPIRKNPLDQAFQLNPLMAEWDMSESIGFSMFESLTHVVSPYQFNPLNYNPLRDIIKDVIDFDALHNCRNEKLFISATNVRNGQVKIFENKEIDEDVVIASTSLPYMFQAVEIDGEAYWDGGYMGNPALFPLFYNVKSRDILIAHINPIVRNEIPRTAIDIHNRINEVTFNSSLIKELRSIAFVKKLIHGDMIKDEFKDQYRDILLHSIRADETLKDLSIASKFDTSWDFLTDLRNRGYVETQNWLKKNFKHLNKDSTVDLVDTFLN
ncbi:MAG: alpha/beta hydrolase [Micavibrio sp.]|nr:alpha/beta hydrolase [Micavibrio sp.]